MGNVSWEIVVAIIGSVFASGGFWHFLENRSKWKKNNMSLLMGIAYREIIQLCAFYITRYRNTGEGITTDEYTELNKYLVAPYKANGGDGTVDKLMIEVNKIPIDED